jgi:hypothetical protein
MERELADADIVISQPFYPFYLTADRIKKAPKLKMAITAGIGSDHVDLQAAMDRKIGEFFIAVSRERKNLMRSHRFFVSDFFLPAFSSLFLNLFVLFFCFIFIVCLS